MKHPASIACLALAVFSFVGSPACAVDYGFGKVDVTPDRPVRLSGYGNRDKPSEGVEQRLFARAVALRDEKGNLAILANADTIGFPGEMATAIHKQIEQKWKVPRDRFSLCSTHSHTAPHLAGGLSNLFSTPLTPEEDANRKRATDQLQEGVVKAVEIAIGNLAPAKARFGEGKATFAANRRVLKDGKWTGFGVNPAGPVDHSVGVLKIVDADGKSRGVIFNYACHCTTLGGDYNRITGDWAGYSAEYLEDRFPGVVAISTIGCGADANPEPRGKLEMSKAHGRVMGMEVERVMGTNLASLDAFPITSFGFAGLPIDRPNEADLRMRLASKNPQTAAHAKKMLEIKERMGRLPETYPAPLQVWRFGEALTWVFMGGEVVVDYALRLKREIKPGQVWVTAYANDVYGYLASERVRKEGGYEVDFSQIYYGQPGAWSEGTEEVVISRIKDLIRAPSAEQALFPAEGLKSFRLAKGFEIDLVASEPQVADPVNLAWGADGKLWVVEMADYPRGSDDQYAPTGRIKLLEDADGDGRFEKSTLFMDRVNFPNGIHPWRDGVVVSAAPEIFFARDNNGDGKADTKTVLFSGFDEANPQHRVHGFGYTLDGWLAIGGDNSGKIKSSKTGKTIDMRGRDARIQPDLGLLEPVTGKSQFGRHRSDWGEWFGGNNSYPIVHYVIDDGYLRRNPYVALPPAEVHLLTPAANPPVFPASRTVDRFNDLHTANRFTSACSPIIYRDALLGEDSARTGFVCEPVHNLVHRVRLNEDGVSFKGDRFPDDAKSEFAASTDPWSRPVRIETGPDGALWIVDMYRMVIEHPEWIPESWQARLNLRAGEDKGRIYRVYPEGKRPERLPNLARLTNSDLVREFESSNGWRRDTAQRLLLERGDKSVVSALKEMARKGQKPTARLHALYTLAAMDSLDRESVLAALSDSDPHMRRHGIVCSEASLRKNDLPANVIERLADDADLKVCLQLALSLGEWSDSRAGRLLGTLAAKHLQNPLMTAATLTSASKHADAMLATLLERSSHSAERARLVDFLVSTIVRTHGDGGLRRVLALIAPPDREGAERWQLEAAAGLFDQMAKRNVALSGAEYSRAGMASLIAKARKLASDGKSTPVDLTLASKLLGRLPDHRNEDLALLLQMLAPQQPREVQAAAVAALSAVPSDDVPKRLIENWARYSPALRNDVLDSLLARPAWTAALLDALEKRTIQPSEIDALRRDRLVRSSNDALRARAERVMSASAPVARESVLAEYRSVLGMPGNLFRGALVFQRACAACHQFRGLGIEIGPQLASIKDKSGEALLTALLDPNRAVETKYHSYSFVLHDGRVLSGMIASETATGFTLVDVGGKRMNVLRVDIEEMSSTGKSLMPDGLEKDLSLESVADVIALIQSQPVRLESVEGMSAAASVNQWRRAGAAAVSNVKADEASPAQASWLGTRPLNLCRQTSGASTVSWDAIAPKAEAGKPAAFLLPAAMGWQSMPEGKFSLRINDSPVLDFPLSMADGSWTSGDGKIRATFVAMAYNDEDATGAFIIELPADDIVAGKPVHFAVTGSASNSRRWFGLLSDPR